MQLDLANVIPQAQEAQLDADIKALEQYDYSVLHCTAPSVCGQFGVTQQAVFGCKSLESRSKMFLDVTWSVAPKCLWV